MISKTKEKISTVPLIRKWLKSDVGYSNSLGIAYLSNALITGAALSAESTLDLGISGTAQDLVSGTSVLGVLLIFRKFNKSKISQKPFHRNIYVWVTAAIVANLAPVILGSLVSSKPIQLEVLKIIPIGVISSITILMIYTVVIASFKELRETAHDLANVRHRLLAIGKRLEQDLLASKRQLQNRLTESISPVLDSIYEELRSVDPANNAAIEKTSANLRQAIEGIVRPLSHELGNSANFQIYNQLTSVTAIERKITFRSLADRLNRKVNLSNAFLPNQLLVFLVVFEVTSVHVISGVIDSITYAIPSAIISTLIILFAKKFTNKIRLPFYMALILAAVVNVIAALPFQFLSKYSSLTEEVVAGLLIGVIILAVFLSYFGLLIDRRRSMLSDEQLANQELAAAVTHARNEISIVHKRTARMLHGGVQAKLQSALLRLRRSPQLSNEEIQEVISDISQAKFLLEKTEQSSVLTLGQGIDDLIDFWDGVCEIETNLTASIDELISNDQVTTECVIEVVREAISNAVKHDHAGCAKVDFEIADHYFQITISHKGDLIEENFNNDEKSYGMQMIAELSNSHELIAADDYIYLSAKFPIQNSI